MTTVSFTPAPTYVVRDGQIVTTTGARISVEQARDLRSFHLDDIIDVERRWGELDPQTADALQARDLRLARELRLAIREVTGPRPAEAA